MVFGVQVRPPAPNQGNPTQITNFEYKDNIYNKATFDWEGRNLINIKVYNSSLAVIAEIIYTYNDQGIRIEKIVDDMFGKIKYEYKLSGTQLIAEKKSVYNNVSLVWDLNYSLIYSYDYDGTLVGITHVYSSGYTVDYIVVSNIQGDVTHLLTAYGNEVVHYQYDAYGNVLDISGSGANHIGTFNSIRYRGYIYDTETSFYYLRTRYYNPEISRFINSDGLLGRDTSLKSANMYAYCENNPIAYVDPEGESILLSLTVILVSSLVAFCVVATTPADSGTGDNISVSAGGGTPDSAGFGGDAMGIGVGIQTNIIGESCSLSGDCSESITTFNGQLGPVGGSHSINEDGTQSITASFLIFYVSVDPTNPLDIQSYGAGLSWSVSAGQTGFGSFSASYDIDFFGLIVDAFKGGSDNESD